MVIVDVRAYVSFTSEDRRYFKQNAAAHRSTSFSTTLARKGDSRTNQKDPIGKTQSEAKSNIFKDINSIVSASREKICFCIYVLKYYHIAIKFGMEVGSLDKSFKKKSSTLISRIVGPKCTFFSYK